LRLRARLLIMRGRYDELVSRENRIKQALR